LEGNIGIPGIRRFTASYLVLNSSYCRRSCVGNYKYHMRRHFW